MKRSSHSFFNRVGDFRFVERKSLAGNAPCTLVHRYSTVVYEEHSIVQYSTVYYSTLPHNSYHTVPGLLRSLTRLSWLVFYRCKCSSDNSDCLRVGSSVHKFKCHFNFDFLSLNNGQTFVDPCAINIRWLLGFSVRRKPWSCEFKGWKAQKVWPATSRTIIHNTRTQYIIHNT